MSFARWFSRRTARPASAPFPRRCFHSPPRARRLIAPIDDSLNRRTRCTPPRSEPWTRRRRDAAIKRLIPPQAYIVLRTPKRSVLFLTTVRQQPRAQNIHGEHGRPRSSPRPRPRTRPMRRASPPEAFARQTRVRIERAEINSLERRRARDVQPIPFPNPPNPSLTTIPRTISSSLSVFDSTSTQSSRRSNGANTAPTTTVASVPLANRRPAISASTSPPHRPSTRPNARSPPRDSPRLVLSSSPPSPFAALDLDPDVDVDVDANHARANATTTHASVPPIARSRLPPHAHASSSPSPLPARLAPTSHRPRVSPSSPARAVPARAPPSLSTSTPSTRPLDSVHRRPPRARRVDDDVDAADDAMDAGTDRLESRVCRSSRLIDRNRVIDRSSRLIDRSSRIIDRSSRLSSPRRRDGWTLVTSRDRSIDGHDRSSRARIHRSSDDSTRSIERASGSRGRSLGES